MKIRLIIYAVHICVIDIVISILKRRLNKYAEFYPLTSEKLLSLDLKISAKYCLRQQIEKKYIFLYQLMKRYYDFVKNGVVPMADDLK